MTTTIGVNLTLVNGSRVPNSSLHVQRMGTLVTGPMCQRGSFHALNSDNCLEADPSLLARPPPIVSRPVFPSPAPQFGAAIGVPLQNLN